jgi:hypothetical protein
MFALLGTAVVVAVVYYIIKFLLMLTIVLFDEDGY